jgi:hypothetical protein
MKDLCSELDITHITSRPKNPKAQGAIERTHRLVMTALGKAQAERPETFNLLIELENFLDHYNNNVSHTSTKLVPSVAINLDEKDPEDLKLIDEAILNIRKSKRLKPDETAEEDDDNDTFEPDDRVLLHNSLKIVGKKKNILEYVDPSRSIKKKITFGFLMPVTILKEEDKNDYRVKVE